MITISKKQFIKIESELVKEFKNKLADDIDGRYNIHLVQFQNGDLNYFVHNSYDLGKSIGLNKKIDFLHFIIINVFLEKLALNLSITWQECFDTLSKRKKHQGRYMQKLVDDINSYLAIK